MEWLKVNNEDAHVNIPVVLNKIDSLVLKSDYLIVEDSDDKQKDLISFLNTTANKYLADQHYLVYSEEMERQQLIQFYI